jgi:hypothetical protein
MRAQLLLAEWVSIDTGMRVYFFAARHAQNFGALIFDTLIRES